jgi:hypothetical protein
LEKLSWLKSREINRKAKLTALKIPEKEIVEVLKIILKKQRKQAGKVANTVTTVVANPDLAM